MTMKIITTKKYNQMRKMQSMMHEKIMELLEENAELRKKLLYQQTYNDTFKRKLDEIIFPNTDKRGLGEQEVPINFPDLW